MLAKPIMVVPSTKTKRQGSDTSIQVLSFHWRKCGLQNDSQMAKAMAVKRNRMAMRRIIIISNGKGYTLLEVWNL